MCLLAACLPTSATPDSPRSSLCIPSSPARIWVATPQLAIVPLRVHIAGGLISSNQRTGPVNYALGCQWRRSLARQTRQLQPSPRGRMQRRGIAMNKLSPEELVGQSIMFRFADQSSLRKQRPHSPRFGHVGSFISVITSSAANRSMCCPLNSRLKHAESTCRRY